MTQDELLYEVDQNDCVIGPRSRREVHHLDLLHRSVHILVLNPMGQLYVQKRAPTKDRNPDLWDTSAAGHVDFGETYEEAAIRELEEELGIQGPLKLRHLFKLHPEADTGWEFVETYEVIHHGEITPNPLEITGGRWVEKASIQAWVDENPSCFTQTFRRILHRYLALSC